MKQRNGYCVKSMSENSKRNPVLICFSFKPPTEVKSAPPYELGFT